LHLTAVGILPFTERISGFAKLGVAQVRGDDGIDKSNDITPHAGLGLSYDLTNAVVLRADYDYYGRAQLGQDGISAKTRTQALSFGFDFHF
jgi:opacity protein-like surface antigen